MDLDDVDRLWERHPAWRLLRARNAPLVLAFLGGRFIDENRGAVSAGELVSSLDDFLYAVHRSNPERYLADPATYLDDWAAPEAGWLRRFYPAASEEVHYEATPALERAYSWAQSLRSRAFVGTESRLQTAVELLRQIVHGSETDVDQRIAEIERRRAAIEVELAEAREGRFDTLDDTALRERYQQFATTARELLGDFREVEENFRVLDRSAREKIAGWEGGKGELLADLVSSRTDITASDQGRSFQAFYDLLLSEERQTELADLLEAVQSLPQLAVDRRLRGVHHDWADAAERTQQTVRNLSEQLRRFLGDQVWVENRRVLDLVRTVEAAALAVRENPPRDVGLVVDQPGLPIALPFERPLYDPQPDVAVDSLPAPADLDTAELAGLLTQRFVDTERLAENVRAVVPLRTWVALDEIVTLYPIEEGIAEILGYLSLNSDSITVEMTDEQMVIDYTDVGGVRRRVRMKKALVTRA